MKDRSKQLTAILAEVQTNIIPDVDQEKWNQLCKQGAQLFENSSFNIDITRRRDTVCKEVSEVLGELFKEQRIEIDPNDQTLNQLRKEVWLRLLIVRGLEKLSKDDKDAAREMIQDGKLGIAEARKAGLAVVPVFNEAIKGFSKNEPYSSDEEIIARKDLAAKLFGEYLAKALGRKNPIEIEASFQIRKNIRKDAGKPKNPENGQGSPEKTEVPTEQNPELYAQIDRTKLATELLGNSMESLKVLIEEELQRLNAIIEELTAQLEENNILAIEERISQLEDLIQELNQPIETANTGIKSLIDAFKDEENPAVKAAKAQNQVLIDRRNKYLEEIEELDDSKEGKGPIVEKLKENILALTEKYESLGELMRKLELISPDTIRLLDQVTNLTSDPQENAEE